LRKEVIPVKAKYWGVHMNQPTPEFQIGFLTYLQRLFSEGLFVATYKYALLMALADICVERGSDNDAPLEVSTRLIAEKFIRYYWRQSMPLPLAESAEQRVLRQNTGRQVSSALF
jgi:hypothetical protein